MIRLKLLFSKHEQHSQISTIVVRALLLLSKVGRGAKVQDIYTNVGRRSI